MMWNKNLAENGTKIKISAEDLLKMSFDDVCKIERIRNKNVRWGER